MNYYHNNKGQFDLACFGYLSMAKLIKMTGFPVENSVSAVSRIVPTVAADAPIVALLSAQLGLTSVLFSNEIQDTEENRYIFSALDHHALRTSIKAAKSSVTPQMFIIESPYESKTILTFMPDIFEQLTSISLQALDNARLVYVDLYTEILEASLRTIRYAIQKGIPVFLNLSSHDLDLKLAAIKNLKGITIIQVSNLFQEDPRMLVDTILSKTKAQMALVTLGQRGVLGANKSMIIEVPALKIKEVETHHGAGAAFSAGFAFAHLGDFGFKDALVCACALGGVTRQVPNGLGQHSARELQNIIQHYPGRPTISTR
jgi:sugar/nucleoside kinase (ribokinase family)